MNFLLFFYNSFLFYFEITSTDKSIEFLSKDEIAKIIIVEAENETERCYKETVARILEYRANGDACLDGDFFEKYAPSKGSVHPKAPFGYLMDIANTIINWMEYTQLAKRDENRLLRIIPDKAGDTGMGCHFFSRGSS